MTREEMAQAVEHEAGLADQVVQFASLRIESHGPATEAHKTHAGALKAAAAELRKTCATCEHFAPEAEAWSRGRGGACVALNAWVPVDGSGFCHRWEPKP